MRVGHHLGDEQPGALLGQELQRLREPTGLSAAEAGERIGVGRAHMSHIEAGRTNVSADKVLTLAEAYGCEHRDLVNGLLTMAEADGRGWWSDYKKVVNPQLLDLAELEGMAVGFRTFQWLYVPGLLQTPAYTRALIRSGDNGIGSDRLARHEEFRLRRQRILERDPAPAVRVVIHEGAFRMGFVGPDVMAEQLEYLIEAARSPNITIQLLPFSTATNPAALGAFTILEVGSPELRTVYVEQPITSMFLTEQHQLEQYTAHFCRLENVALAPLDPHGPAGEGTFGLAQHLLYSLKERSHVRS
ncbi:helix-turn-helix domain-containing protein [Streptomyces mayteni]